VIQRIYGLLARVVMFLHGLRRGPEEAAAIAITVQND
jgi:hypothetical protein